MIIVRATIHGEQYAQVDNADPFAPAVWRSPVHRTPEWIIWLVQLVRLLAGGLVRAVTRCWTWRPVVLVLAWFRRAGRVSSPPWPVPLGGLGILRIMWPAGSPGWSRCPSGAGGGGGVTGGAGGRC